jgi:hypothetical protein
MKSKTTALWFVLAVALATAIWLLNTYFLHAPAGPKPILPGLRTEDVTRIDIVPGGGKEFSLVLTNGDWMLDRPFQYPAQTEAVNALLAALKGLKPVVTLSAGELNSQKNAEAGLGFDNPQFTVDLTAGSQTWHLRVGNKTAPGDGIYVRLLGAADAAVTDTAWLKLLKPAAEDWRDTTLVDVPEAVDWLVITNGSQAIELRRGVTNRLWRMVSPLQARADNLLIVSALEKLRGARVSRFVSDDPKANLAAYGLAPATLDVWLGDGTNLLTALHGGKDVSDSPSEMYARRQGWNTVVTTAKDGLAPWLGAVNDFRDRNLFEVSGPVAEIEVTGAFPFTLQQRASNAWTVVGEKFPVDPVQVNGFIHLLANLRIAHFIQDAPTASGLQAYGLANPTNQIIVRSAIGDSNSVIARLQFGVTGTNNEVFAKRADEDFVYSVALADLNNLPLRADFFRDRQIWNFSETNVAQVTLREAGKVRQLIRTGTNEWSLAPGSQGIINPPAIEETIHRLGKLEVAGWLGRNVTPQDIGLTTNGLSIAIELKSGDKYTLDFGAEVRAQTALAAVTLDGERWAFVFPPVLFPLVAENLTIPPKDP